MKKRTKLLLVIVYMFCTAILLEAPAYAYIDPATTTYVIQTLVGVVIACGATILVFWRKIQFWFKKKRAERLKKARTKKNGK